jgi:hypothetical protein
MNKEDYEKFSAMFQTNSALEPTVLSAQTILDCIDLITPVLYYGISTFVDRGTLYICKESSGTWTPPEYVVVHPEDLTELRRRIVGRRLVHLSKWKNDYTKGIKHMDLL